MKNIFLLLAILVSQVSVSQHYMRNYKITADGVDVGNLTARKHAAGDTISYSISADIILTMVYKIHVATELNTIYVGESMISSSSSTYLNDQLLNTLQADLIDGKYQMNADGHRYKTFAEFASSSARLYFNMPEDKARIFSELDGRTRIIRKTGEKKYELQDLENPTASTVYDYSTEEGLFSISIKRAMLPDLKISQVREPIDLEKDAGNTDEESGNTDEKGQK